MVLFVKPHQQQEWHIDEAALEYEFLIFREDFMRTFIADKFFVYRLQYCQQTETPPYLMCSGNECEEYQRLLKKYGQSFGSLKPTATTSSSAYSTICWQL